MIITNKDITRLVREEAKKQNRFDKSFLRSLYNKYTKELKGDYDLRRVYRTMGW